MPEILFPDDRGVTPMTSNFFFKKALIEKNNQSEF